MDKDQKNILRVLVGKLRHVLVGTLTDSGFIPGNLDRELERIGIAADGTIAPIDTLNNTRNGEKQAYRIAADQLAPLPEAQRSAVRTEIIERAAYTWINRLLALRAMEVRNLIDGTLRADVAYNGLSEKLYLLLLYQSARTSDADKGWWAVLTDACQELSTALPGLFTLDDPAAALHPSADILVQCIDLVGGRQPIIPGIQLEQLDSVFADPDAIGWAYQFYQEDAKDAIDLKCKNGGKAASRAELAAKTQLFTEPYMVQWLLQNSLGRSYHEAYPNSQLPEKWPYYIHPDQRPNQTVPERIFPLEELTLLDPCMGSGHFLREAFDMFVDMYREQQPALGMEEIANLVLSQHIFGIDLDPRAAQLAALTLFLRAWEQVRAEQRQMRKIASGPYVPPTMNLATTPTNLNKGMLQRHLQRHPQDRVLEPFFIKMFEGLEQANILGSLLRSREYIDQAIEELRKPHTIQMDFNPGDAEFRRDVTEMAHHDPLGLRQILFDRVTTSFKADAGSKDDVSIMLFGREAEQGVRLLQVLDRQYAVVVTNPPYLGSSYMEYVVKSYIEKYYVSGKRDLYTTFILRCLELGLPAGRVAMVTMQSWLFLRSYVDLRAISEDKLDSHKKHNQFLGMLRETSIETIAHLGSGSFEEINGEVVKSVMFIVSSSFSNTNEIKAFRLCNIANMHEKSKYLEKKDYAKKKIFDVSQKDLLAVKDSIISVYHLPKSLLELLKSGKSVKNFGYLSWGISSSDNDRFLRLWWEIKANSDRWLPHVKGGGYCKWVGFDFWLVDWRGDGIVLKTFIVERYPYLKKNYELKIRGYTFNSPGWTYSSMATQGLAVRKLYNYQTTNAKSPALFLEKELPFIGGFLNSIVSIFVLKGLTSNINVDEGYIAALPIGNNYISNINLLTIAAIFFKNIIINNDIVERNFFFVKDNIYPFYALLHCIEGIINSFVVKSFGLSSQDLYQIQEEVGTPAGWYPLIVNYDTLPDLPDDIDPLELPQEFFNYFTQHQRISLDTNDLKHNKIALQALYEAGPSAKKRESEEDNISSHDSENEEITSGSHTPIPTETFLEELSVKMQLHPISIYWLLEELRAEGVRCKPEEKRLLEDRLTVLVLRLLGHRWPKQIEAGEPVPSWADPDGIIPLVLGTGERTLAELIRDRLYAEDGAVSAQQSENLLEELTGQTLEQWLRNSFFTRHISQFKHRPIAWHLASTPARSSNKVDTGKSKKKKATGQRTPIFECFLYYHVTSGDALARIRTQYVEPLLQQERLKIHQSQSQTLFASEVDDTPAQIARERIRELEEFTEKLRQIEEQGFACPDLTKVLAAEPLDRWSGDGYQRSASQEDLRHQEEAWHVDINDGVRVNLAPLQLAGVLTKDVLKVVDARKAIADRVRWRADERRWVREGKLPRCGWMEELVPASQTWEDLAGQREIEQLKLAQKRLDLQDNEQEVVEA